MISIQIGDCDSGYRGGMTPKEFQRTTIQALLFSAVFITIIYFYSIVMVIDKQHALRSVSNDVNGELKTLVLKSLEDDSLSIRERIEIFYEQEHQFELKQEELDNILLETMK